MDCLCATRRRFVFIHKGIRMLYGTPFGTSACGKLFKRSLFTDVEFPYGKFSEDLFTIYKTILKSENVTYVGFDGYFYYYRDEGSIVVSGYKEKHLEALDAIDDIARAVKGKTQFDNALSTQYINVVYGQIYAEKFTSASLICKAFYGKMEAQ